MEVIGSVDERDIQCFTMKNMHGMSVSVINYGATLWSVKVPDCDGKIEEVTLNYQGSFSAFLSNQFNYYGSTCGRYANRIKLGTFAVDGETYKLPINNGPNSLHGGSPGWSNLIWNGTLEEDDRGTKVMMTLFSPDGDQGYPGNVQASVTYILSKTENTLTMEYRARSDKKTVVNMCNHTYWNLSGDMKESTIFHHELLLRCSRYLPVDHVQIPTGELKSVDCTPFDFRSFHPIGDSILSVDGCGQPGYDHCYAIDKSDHAMTDSPTLAAILRNPLSRRQMTVHTTNPGVQLYTANWVLESPPFIQHAACCLETQHFPNSPNEASFPSTLLSPGEEYYHHTVYSFSNYS